MCQDTHILDVWTRSKIKKKSESSKRRNPRAKSASFAGRRCSAYTASSSAPTAATAATAQTRERPQFLGVWLSRREHSKGPLAPATDFAVHGHLVPVFGAVPADLVLAVALMDAGGAIGLGEVDQVYMLMPRPDVLELHPRGTVELHGVRNVLALLPH